MTGCAAMRDTKANISVGALPGRAASAGGLVRLGRMTRTGFLVERVFADEHCHHVTPSQELHHQIQVVRVLRPK